MRTQYGSVNVCMVQAMSAQFILGTLNNACGHAQIRTVEESFSKELRKIQLMVVCDHCKQLLSGGYRATEAEGEVRMREQDDQAQRELTL